MSRQLFTRSLCAIAVTTSFCGIAVAADTPQFNYNPSMYLLPQANGMEADDAWNVDKRKVGAGLKLGKAVSESFDIQFGGSYASERQENVSKYSQTLFGVDALWLFSRKTFRPFLLAGFGGERDGYQNNLASTGKNAPYINGGAGFQWRWSDRMFMQFDARYVYGFLNENTWGRDSNGNWLINLGVGFHFGDTPVAAPAVVAVAKAEPKAAEPAPEPAPAPKPAAEKVTLAADTLFDFNKATLRDEGKTKLDEVATLTQGMAVEVIVAVGHTDRIGSDKYNLPLSERRAAAVKEYLVSKGIDPNRIYTEGKGKEGPVSNCGKMGAENGGNKKLVECLQPDRRVDLEVIGTRQP